MTVKKSGVVHLHIFKNTNTYLHLFRAVSIYRKWVWRKTLSLNASEVRATFSKQIMNHTNYAIKIANANKMECHVTTYTLHI